MEHLARVEEKKAALIAEAAAVPPGEAAGSVSASGPALPGASALLVQLKGIGMNDALLLQNEVFYRDFRNRRELGAWAGLVPVRGRAAGSIMTRASARRATRPCASTWCRWRGVGCAGSPRVRLRNGSINIALTAMAGSCASGRSLRLRASC